MLTRLLDVFGRWACKSSPRQRQMIIKGLAGFLFGLYKLSRHRSFIQKNIRSALSLSPKEQTALAHKHLENLLDSIVTLLRFRLFAQGSEPVAIEVEGYTHFLEAHAQGKGVILVSAHLGCWELFPAVLGQAGFEVHALVQRPSVPAFDQFFKQSRAYARVQTAYNDTLSGLRPILRALKQGAVLGLLIDQHGESNQILGDFFGHRVSMPEGPYFLAKKTGALIVPVFTYRQADTHLIQFFPSLDLLQFSSPTDLMQSLYQQIENTIRQHPAEWLWSYNRWDKYQPCPRCLRV
ncbi:MAG: lysophospholipid acyltransferase family protein [Candidatus Sericytochromatia bacterium]